jgi:hypothetical protein
VLVIPAFLILYTENTLMKKLLLSASLISLMSISPFYLIAQRNPSAKEKTPVASIRDIPHETNFEKWMWIHRCFAFFITKDRPVNYDTAYIKTHYKRIVVTLPVSTRFLRFSIKDLKSGSRLRYAPNLQSDLGIGISSRWATFIVNTGIKVFGKDDDIKGESKYQDYQLNIYGRKITTDMFMQFYNGFYISNSKSFAGYVSDKPYAIRSDVNAFNMGVSSYYIFNHRKYSYGGSFSFVDVQKKSAGSALLGVYYSYFGASGSPSLVTAPFTNSFDSLSLFKNGHTHNFGINLGYIYTIIFLRRFNATASLTQGIGASRVTYARDDNSTFQKLVVGTGKLNVRLAMRYDNGRYFVGTMCMFDNFLSIRKSNSTFDYSFGKFMVYIGYRFSVLKPERIILRRLKLIDY